MLRENRRECLYALLDIRQPRPTAPRPLRLAAPDLSRLASHHSTRGAGHMRTRDFIVGTVAIVILVAVTRWVALSILYHRT
jgi:hypothetical protein